MISSLDIRNFGAKCDWAGPGTGTDDTEAIQRAIDATYGDDVKGGDVVVSGPCRITQPLKLHRKSITFRGVGLQSMGDPAAGALIWDGPAGKPMIHLQDAVGCVITIRLVGNDTNQPSAGIEIAANSTPVSPDNQSIHIRDMAVGPLPYGPAGAAVGRLERGILVSGNTSCDRTCLTNVEINAATEVGIDIQNYNAIWNDFRHVVINGWGQNTPVAIKTAANFNASTLNLVWCDLGIDTASYRAGPELFVTNIGSEKLVKWFEFGIDTVAAFYGGRHLMREALPGVPFGEYTTMGLKGAFAMHEVHLLGMRQYFEDEGRHRPTFRFNMTRPRNSLTFVGNRELRHTDIEPVCGPEARAHVLGSFTGGPDLENYDGTFLINDLGPNDKVLRPDVIEAQGRIGARDAQGVMRYLKPPVGGGPAVWS